MDIRRYLILGSLMMVAVFFSGCATPANREAMTVDTTSFGKQFDRAVAVHVSGGQETSPMWTSEVSNEEFQAALEASIQKSGLFSTVIRSEIGDYRLDVQLIELKQPIIGINFEVTARSQWRIRKSMNDAPIWREDVTTAYTAQFGDSLYAVHRLRLANEGAIRENIQAGLAKVAQLDL